MQHLVKRSSNSTSSDYLFELAVAQDWLDVKVAMDTEVDGLVMEFSRFQSQQEGHWHYWRLLWWIKVWLAAGLMCATSLELCGRITGRDW